MIAPLDDSLNQSQRIMLAFTSAAELLTNTMSKSEERHMFALINTMYDNKVQHYLQIFLCRSFLALQNNHIIRLLTCFGRTKYRRCLQLDFFILLPHKTIHEKKKYPTETFFLFFSNFQLLSFSHYRRREDMETRLHLNKTVL